LKAFTGFYYDLNWKGGSNFVLPEGFFLNFQVFYLFPLLIPPLLSSQNTTKAAITCFSSVFHPLFTFFSEDFVGFVVYAPGAIYPAPYDGVVEIAKQ
jgi:hypothetical protein